LSHLSAAHHPTMAWRMLSLLVTLGCSWAAEAPASWSGSIEIVEALKGRDSSARDRAELDRLIQTSEDRLRWARIEAPTLPPAMAGVVRNDIGVMESERDRAILARGGEPFPVGKTTYTISRGRILIEGELITVLIDRNRNLAWIRNGGQVEERALPRMTEVEPVAGTPGPTVFGYASLTTNRRIDGRDHQVTWLPDVPNPYALAHVDEVGPRSGADLVSDLARLPGLPALVVTDLGTVVLQLNVSRISSGPVPEATFAPLKP
jgi:hypothetical protein